MEDIKLNTSLTLQTAILTDQLKWEKWEVLRGAMIPTKESIEKILPGYYDKYNPNKRHNPQNYLDLLKSRFKQRRDYLKSSDLMAKPELLNKLLNVLEINTN